MAPEGCGLPLAVAERLGLIAKTRFLSICNQYCRQYKLRIVLPEFVLRLV